MAKFRIILLLVIAGIASQIEGKVKISYKLHQFENVGHIELDGGCCDPGCGSCDNRFNLCFDNYGGNNDITDCAYGAFQTNRLYENNDNFNFPASLSTSLTNPIILTINAYQTGFRSKIDVWDKDLIGSDDKIDYYGYNYRITPDRTEALATEHSITLAGAGESVMVVKVKVYCDIHYYGTDSGCTTYCVARDDSSGHYDCNDFTGAKMCHPGWEGSNCHVEIDECDSTPCQYGGACTDLLNDYSCACPAGTTGKICDDIDECIDQPCENNSTCENKLNDFDCHCLQHYSGDRCEFAIDYCDSNPCLNGATCLGQDENSVIECVCVSGYSGDMCDVDIDECESFPCMNDGTCTDAVNGFVCSCPDGFSGQICESDIRDECASNPCANSATCVDIVQGYICVCPPGFHNDTCEEEVNECETNPCVFGVCEDEIAGYTCNCSTGYTGTNCTENIDDCLENDCKHNSTCVDGVASYNCSCIPGYTGSLCEVDINECEASPCFNGRCQEGEVVNNFTCDCTSTGFTGPLCEEDVDECLIGDRCPPGSTCVNEPGSYRCEEIPVTTPLPGLCRTSICYNGGSCILADDRYMCVCTDEFTGELCETPTEPCRSNPCQNGGYCRINTAENGTVSYECRCETGYSGTDCDIKDPETVIGSPPRSFPWYIILIVVILVIIIVVISFFIYRHRKRKANLMDEGPTVFANPHTESVRIPDTLGATAAPALPPKGKLDKLGEPDSSVYFSNNIYHDIHDPELRGACALPAPPPYSKEDTHDDNNVIPNPYASSGFVQVGNGHAVSPTEGDGDSHYESARLPTENEYTSDPTSTGSVRRPFELDEAYDTAIVKEASRPMSTNDPPPLSLGMNRPLSSPIVPSPTAGEDPYATTIVLQGEPDTIPEESPAAAEPSSPVTPSSPSSPNPYDSIDSHA